jgi:hypothetical protein
MRILIYDENNEFKESLDCPDVSDLYELSSVQVLWPPNGNYSHEIDKDYK